MTDTLRLWILFNVFVTLGLRSLYSALAGVMDKFHYLKIDLGVVLTFVGVKRILPHTDWKSDTLVVTLLMLFAAVVTWSVWPKRPVIVVPPLSPISTPAG